MASDGTVIPGRPKGSNPFPFDSPFLDAMSRLGFADLEKASELESFWWFMGDPDLTPDDVAGAILSALPPETDKEASMRRMGIAEAHLVVEHSVAKVRRVNKLKKK